MYFLFFFLYLVAAEFPLFMLLLIRNWQGERGIFLLLLAFSLILLFAFMFLFRMRLNKPTHPSKKIKLISENLTNQTIIEFLSFFLLPFFTFNIASNGPMVLKIIELLFLLILLTVFLYRSENLLINPLIFFSCNLYKAESVGRHYTVLSSRRRSAGSMEEGEKERFIVINNSLLFFVFDEAELKKVKRNTTRILITITFVILLIVLVMFEDELLHVLKRLLDWLI